ncbi:MAG TPA: hypothetical protein VEY50_03340 [Lysobacter sp.]|nr:hypothetical protein [Lysobacter sp.]
MTTSSTSSTASASCRIEWRPSPALAGALIALGLLGGVGVWTSEAPRGLAMPLALAAPLVGVMQARQELRRPRRDVAVATECVHVDGVRVQRAAVRWRGPLATLVWTDVGGHEQRLLWWPDTLGAADRRALRLAMSTPPARHRGPTMAP